MRAAAACICATAEKWRRQLRRAHSDIICTGYAEQLQSAEEREYMHALALCVIYASMLAANL